MPKEDHIEDVQELCDSDTSEELYAEMSEEEEYKMRMSKTDRTNDSMQLIGIEEAKEWWKSAMGCMENPAEVCEELRQCIVEFIQLADLEKDPEKREILNQKKELKRETWMRCVELKKSYQKQVEDTTKITLKFLPKEYHGAFRDWVKSN